MQKSLRSLSGVEVTSEKIRGSLSVSRNAKNTSVVQAETVGRCAITETTKKG